MHMCSVLHYCLCTCITQPPDLDEITLWSIVLRCMAEPEPRYKLSHVNTLDDVVSLLKSSSKIVVLTGAGVSMRALVCN